MPPGPPTHQEPDQPDDQAQSSPARRPIGERAEHHGDLDLGVDRPCILIVVGACHHHVERLQRVIKETADPRIFPDISIDTTKTGIQTEYGYIRPDAATNSKSGKIEFYAKNTEQYSDKKIAGIVRHESEHRKWQDVQNEGRAEFKELQKEVGEELALAKLDKSEFDRSKYPVMTEINPYLTRESQEKMLHEAFDHPVSKYADVYFGMLAQAQPGAQRSHALDTAIHETLAEIARREYEEGKLPEGVPTWVNLYKAINKNWEVVYAKHHPH